MSVASWSWVRSPTRPAFFFLFIFSSFEQLPPPLLKSVLILWRKGGQEEGEAEGSVPFWSFF